MDTTSPQEQMTRMLSGYWTSQALYVAAKLGIADLLVHGSRSVDDLAQSTNVHAPSLYRLLRGLAGMGVFAEDNAGRFALTPLAECLRSDLTGSQRALAIMSGEEHYQAWGELLYSVQTGKPSFEKLYGMPVFDFLSKNIEQAKIFDMATVELSGGVQGVIDGIGASSNTLTLCFRPSVQSNATKPRPTHWTVRGRTRLKGKDFVAKADRVEMARDDDEAQQSLVVKLEGHAALKYTGKGWMPASRIEFRPYLHILRLVGAQPMRE